MLPPERSRNSLIQDEYELRVLNQDEVSTLSLYDCSDSDLNDFYHNDCEMHRQQRMAETYVFTEHGIIVALISFSNDAVGLSPKVKKRLLPLPMRHYKAIPAVKIARLGVVSRCQRMGIGSLLINFCKRLYVTDNRTGCRLLSVDAYNNERVIKFYKKNGFDFLTEDDDHEKTRIMWCDLKRIEIEE